MKLLVACAAIAFTIPAVAYAQGKAEVFSSAQLNAALAQLAQQANAKGSSGSTLGEFGTHTLMLSERTTSGGAEIHAHFDDIMIVLKGKATIVTGGTLVDAHDAGKGETQGSGIRDGSSSLISEGDVVHVPAGTPHQLQVAPGTTYSALVIKVKE